MTAGRNGTSQNSLRSKSLDVISHWEEEAEMEKQRGYKESRFMLVPRDSKGFETVNENGNGSYKEYTDGRQIRTR